MNDMLSVLERKIDKLEEEILELKHILDELNRTIGSLTDRISFLEPHEDE